MEGQCAEKISNSIYFNVFEKAAKVKHMQDVYFICMFQSFIYAYVYFICMFQDVYMHMYISKFSMISSILCNSTFESLTLKHCEFLSIFCPGKLLMASLQLSIICGMRQINSLNLRQYEALIFMASQSIPCFQVWNCWDHN